MSEIKYLPDDFDFDSMKSEYEENFAFLCASNEPFHIKMKRIYELTGVDKEDFEEHTGFYGNFFRYITKEDYTPSMSAFISMCMGLSLDYATAESLLSTVKVAFNKTDPLHCAYIYLLESHKGLNIEDCNKILKHLGFHEEKQLLGSFGLDERKKAKKS